MFQVGDIINVIGGRRGDRYRVLSVGLGEKLVLRSVNRFDPSNNFTVTENLERFELDKIYARRKKLDKIRDNIDSLVIMEHAKKAAELNRKAKWLLMMEIRKNKIRQICSKLETR